MIIDSTGVGDPTYGDLSGEYPRVEGYRISAASKPPLIENLSVMIENGEITYPEILGLINEIKIFGYENKVEE